MTASMELDLRKVKGVPQPTYPTSSQQSLGWRRPPTPEVGDAELIGRRFDLA